MTNRTPLEYEFWSEEERKAWDVMAPVFLEVWFSGAVNGHAALPKNLRVFVSWDVVNEAAIEYLRNYRMGMWAKVTDTTRKRSQKIIEDWVRQGEPLPVLEKKLEPLFGKARAERIAVTEVTRAYAEGNQQAWRATGLVTANKWQTGRDDIVCPFCRPLHNVIVPLGEGFTPDGPGLGPTSPPLHVGCRCYLLPVTDTKALGDQIDRILYDEGYHARPVY